MAYQFMLMGAMAAGAALDLYQSKRRERYTRMGEELERNEMRLQMQQEQLASSEQSLFQGEQLRDILATQRALAASRGQLSGAGSNLAVSQASIRAFNADEHARQLTQTFRKNQFESAQRLQGINRTARNQERRFSNIAKGVNLASSFADGGSFSDWQKTSKRKAKWDSLNKHKSATMGSFGKGTFANTF